MESVPASAPFAFGLKSGQFSVFACAGDEQALKDVAVALKEHAAQVCKDLETKYAALVRVEIFADQESLDRLGMNRQMRGYYAYSGNRRIQMVSPRNPIPNVPIPYPDRVGIAVHEFVHLVNNTINADMPVWLNEGVAAFVGPHRPYSYVCLHGFPIKNVPSLLDVERSYYKVTGADLFSYSLVDYIVSEHGMPALNRLLRSPSSMEAILGIKHDEIERRWRTFIERHYVGDNR